MKNNFLESAIRQIESYKAVGEKAIDQLTDEQVLWQYNEESSSIAVVAKHVVGNQFSRWTNFLIEDGEKEWRERDAEFVNTYTSKTEMLNAWDKGWDCFISVLKNLSEDDLKKTVYIRKEPHSVIDAITRQLCHYSYHIGQIVYVAKMLRNEEWKSLSIPKNKSAEFKTKKFSPK
ncbi:DUF1572 family protein [Urechidicola vernalis]|uniref:DUF1572 family protein n=1 Tax=Urechidicola vernalis TaxID=3075600 RepID=A0ABU2Y0D0_9FLAO|nr:DUF1572 family protein [Urechidicola sp. P050]MDT0551631.1 DUF1572 family protein [Urechidicola sp. P050]